MLNRHQLERPPLDRNDRRAPSPAGSIGARAAVRRILRRPGAVAAALLLLAPGLAMAQPTVNGLFYGDGDDTRYQPYAISIGGSVLYSYLDAATTTLYVALVVDHSVNDNVCAKKGDGNLYLQSGDAGDPIYWTSHRDCKRGTDSEYASFTLQCAPNSPNSWEWRQALGCAQVGGPPPSSWVSNAGCPSSAGTIWPPSIVASTSWVAGVNAWQANPGPAWNLYFWGSSLSDWKTPYVDSSPNDVTAVPGYPTYSPLYEWEWSVVYEWSVDLGPAGTNCGDEAIYFLTGESHHSPPKSGGENDSFPPPLEPPILSDWGDLPDSYSTTSGAGGPQHYYLVNGPYLGSALQNEADGVPTADATGDGSEEDGVTAIVTGNWTTGSTQQISVEVSNAPGGAVLAAWFDWDGDGVFSAGEYVTWDVVEGTNTLDLTVGAGFDWQTDALNVRFRLFSSRAAAPGGSLDAGDFGGIALDGEVEDYQYPPGSLPVTLNAFSSSSGAGSMAKVRWQTASETDNVGFELLGRVAGRWRPLTDFVPSKGMNSALPQEYEVEVFLPHGLSAIELVDYDTSGRPERFGPFLPGASYGELQQPRRIDWAGPRAQRERRLRDRGFSVVDGTEGSASGAPRWRRLPANGHARRLRANAVGDGLATGPMTHVAVAEPGIQRVTYEALRDGGLDLGGVPEAAVAVTWRGQPVARTVRGRGAFGPGSSIEFVGQPPQGYDALYLDSSLYQISVDASRARAASQVGSGKARAVSASYRLETLVDRPDMYHRQSPTGDPWVEQSVLVRGKPRTVELEIPVAGPVLAGVSRLLLNLGTVTDLPDIIGPDGEPLPEHNVEVWFSGPGSGPVFLTRASTSGQQDWLIEAEIPPGTLAAGTNRVQLRFDSEYFLSLVLIDSYGVSHPGPYLGPELDFDTDPAAGGYRLGGFSSPAVVAYAETEGGALTRLEPRITASGTGYAAELRQIDGAHYWVAESPHEPAVFTTEAPDDLLDRPADLVVIAVSSFVGTPALDEYVAQHADLQPTVIDVEDIYNAAGYGMALPGAITDYLRRRDEVQPFTHVQLVGTDCYDRLNYVSDCVSFLPLPTAPVGVTTYAPSQNRLVDLDGDGVGDKAVGQFSVRDEAELATIVSKAGDWRASGLSASRSALLIAEETDGLHSFSSQTERLRRRLGWPEAELLDMADHPDVGTARETMLAALDEGRALTVFSGHSSPSVWAYRSLLSAADAPALTNHGLPTVIVPLACETTYDISPDADVLGHQLLYAGSQGALAISGAVALSGLDDNERMAGFVLDGLEAGLTLGEAVQAGREALGGSYQELLDNWITQGDVAARMAAP